MKPLRCLIVDDEPLAQNVIENYLRGFSFIEVIGKCENAVSALEQMKRQQVDLMFLDISMPFLSGMDFIKTLKYPPKVILTTAHKEFAAESYELNVLDYLVKPISFERFLKAINKLDISTSEPIKTINPEMAADAFIYVRSEKKNIKVLFRDILFIESLKDYIKIYTQSKTILTQVPISSFEQRLPDNFLRVHRSFIIARDKITAYTQHNVEIGKYEIPIGRNYRSIALRNLNALE